MFHQRNPPITRRLVKSARLASAMRQTIAKLDKSHEHFGKNRAENQP